MHVRYFGTPWPSPERRASICESDQYAVPVEQVVGQRCIECNQPITEKDRGVITACDTKIWGHFWLELPETKNELDEVEPAGKYPVCAYHLLCWLEEVIGGELSETVAERMHLRPGDRPLTPQEIDEMESQGLSVGDEEHEPGKGWFH